MQRLLFEALPAVGGWRPQEVQLLGFSQGGCVALELAKTCQQHAKRAEPLGG
jgi:predicted esterase